jgi:hypothetical protein
MGPFTNTPGFIASVSRKPVLIWLFFPSVQSKKSWKALKTFTNREMVIFSPLNSRYLLQIKNDNLFFTAL